LPEAARTVLVSDGKAHVKDGTYLPEGVAGYFAYEAESLCGLLFQMHRKITFG
jgi:hypothetical protein